MTPGDVMEGIMGRFDGGQRLDQEDEGIAIGVWGELAGRMKPEKAFMPMSPQEVERARMILLRISTALEAAHASNPAPLRPVTPGGR